MEVYRIIALIAIVGVGFSPKQLCADANKGIKIYMKLMKPSCGLSSAKFARTHTQDEWETIKEAGKMREEIQKICPNFQVKREYENDIYDFVYEYAKDSGNIPMY